MYDFISGRLVRSGPGEVVLENGGIGYRLSVSGATAGRLPAAGEVTLYVQHVLRDDRPCLYGFASREERTLFGLLQGASRVGPSLALALLSAMEPGALFAAVDAGDASALARVKGVGRRTAERLCVELKGRLPAAGSLPGKVTDRVASVAAALVALGYPRGDASRVAEEVCAGASTGAALEELVKQGLARVSA